MQASRHSAVGTRFDALDALRALALLWMTVFHFCFDLSHFRYIQQDFYRDPFWTTQRTIIVSLFLLCAGMGQGIAAAQGQSWARFWRRWAQVALCALLVSAGSWLMYPQSFIYFGVLHGLAVMLIVGRLTAHWGHWLWALGAGVLVLKAASPVLLGSGWLAPWAEPLNGRALNWLGLITRKPITEDYVPLLPWLGVLWWGVAAGRWLALRKLPWLNRPVGPVGARLAVWGRWSLSYYMVHQPVLMGGLMALGWLVR